MNTKRNLNNIAAIILLLLSYSVSAQMETNWKKLILKAKEKGNEFIKPHSIEKGKLKSGEKVLDVNMIFYTKNYLIKSDERYHLVIPFYVSGGKNAAVLLRETIFDFYSEWNVINQEGVPVVSSCRVLKDTKKVKLKYWTKKSDPKDIDIKEGSTYYLLGGNQELKQELIQGKTNYLVFSQTKEEHERMKASFFGMLYGVYSLNNEEEYSSLISYFLKQ